MNDSPARYIKIPDNEIGMVFNVESPESLVPVVCFVLFFAGLTFIYYLSKTTQYNQASELRARRRIEDVAYFLSKLEEQLEDAEAQIDKKIDKEELETRVRLAKYDKMFTRLRDRKGG